MTTTTLPQLDYSIDYDRAADVYRVTVDGFALGTVATRIDGDALVAEYTQDLMERGLLRDEPADYAPVLPSAETVLTALGDIITRTPLGRARNAYVKAAELLRRGAPLPQMRGDVWHVPGSKGNVYTVTHGRHGACECEAFNRGLPCVHRAIVGGVVKAMSGGAKSNTAARLSHSLPRNEVIECT